MTSESHNQQEIRLAATSAGSTLFRNNQGAFKGADGRFVRYGVCNPGGSDLIGWTKITITPDMIGRQVAVFTAVEVKSERGRPTLEQTNFILNVNAAGGFAGVARSASDLMAIVKT